MQKFLEVLHCRVYRRVNRETFICIQQLTNNFCTAPFQDLLGTLLRGLHSLVLPPGGTLWPVALTDTLRDFICLQVNVGTHSSVMTSLSILPVID